MRRRLSLQSRSTSRVLLIFVLLTFIAIIAQTWISIREDRQVTLTAEHQNGLVAVRLLEEHASQTLHDAERQLTGVSEALARAPAATALDDAAIRRLITQGRSEPRYLATLLFVNPAGQSWVTSNDYPAFQVDDADRQYTAAMRRNPAIIGTVLARPFFRYYDNQYVMPMARNVYDQQGRYLGLISIDVNVSYFSGVYTRVAKDSKALVALYADDGFVVVRSPFEMSFLSLDVSRLALTQRIRSGPAEGMFEDDQFLGGNQTAARQYTYRKVQDFPVTTVYARDMSAILSAWQARTRDRIIYAAIFIIIHLVLTYALMQHIDGLHHAKELLRRSENKFIAMFRHSPVPLAVLGLDDDVIAEANDAVLQQFAYAPEQFIGRRPPDIALWHDLEARQRYLNQLRRDGAITEQEVRLCRHDGSIITCLLSARIFEVNGDDMVVFSPIDVTHQRLIEAQIRALNEELLKRMDQIDQLNVELEQRVHQRTLKLEQANAHLTETLATVTAMQTELLRSEKMAALGSLVAGVAHELNTPIGNSVTVASTLQEHASALLGELRSARPRRSRLDVNADACVNGSAILIRNLSRAADLIMSFKQVAVDQASDNRRRFNVREVLLDIVLTLEPMYRHSPFALELELESDAEMDGFPGALAQIITNLLVNALKHGFEGREQGKMLLRTRLLAGNQLEIAFSDDGNGIAPGHIERVFDPFFTTKLGQGGSGLGMHIVYNLITTVLGGKVALTSHLGRGTMLTMALPLCAPVAPRAGLRAGS